MSELKTKKNSASVDDFLRAIQVEQRRSDCEVLLEIMKKITGEEPAMWGDSIIGFGEYQFRYASGRAGTWFLTGFSPRKQNLTLYVMAGLERYPGLREKLGKHKIGKSCLYLNELEDAHLPTLKKLIRKSVEEVAKSQQGC